MKVIKNGIECGNDIYQPWKDSMEQGLTEDIYGKQGIILNDDGSRTVYDFTGLDAMFDRTYFPKAKQKVKLNWWQKLKNLFK